MNERPRELDQGDSFERRLRTSLFTKMARVSIADYCTNSIVVASIVLQSAFICECEEKCLITPTAFVEHCQVRIPWKSAYVSLEEGF